MEISTAFKTGKKTDIVKMYGLSDWVVSPGVTMECNYSFLVTYRLSAYLLIFSIQGLTIALHLHFSAFSTCWFQREIQPLILYIIPSVALCSICALSAHFHATCPVLVAIDMKWGSSSWWVCSYRLFRTFLIGSLKHHNMHAWSLWYLL